MINGERRTRVRCKKTWLETIKCMFGSCGGEEKGSGREGKRREGKGITFTDFLPAILIHH